MSLHPMDIGYDAFGRDLETVTRTNPWLDGLIDRVFRLRLQGLEHLPAGRFILVGNHAGAIPWDAIVLMRLMEREAQRVVRPLIEDEVMTVPFLGMWMTRLGAVRASRANATRLLERDEPIAVFPEGAQGISKNYRQRYKLRRFGRGGFVRLAMHNKTPLVPIAFLGPEDTAPLFAKLPVRFGRTHVPYVPVTPGLLPARWAVRILPPIVDHLKLDIEDRVAVAGIAESIRELLQATIDELVELRPSTY